MRRFFGSFLITIGVVFITFCLYLNWQRNDPSRLAFTLNSTQIVTNDTYSNIIPINILIPSLGLNLPIIPANLSAGKWEATTKGISYLVTSPIPGEIGNSILYGHNWPTLLGSLPKLQKEDKIQIYFSDGSIRDFSVQLTSTVNPDQTHILEPANDQRLTLYTCTGFLDSKRFVVTAIRS